MDIEKKIKETEEQIKNLRYEIAILEISLFALQSIKNKNNEIKTQN